MEKMKNSQKKHKISWKKCPEIKNSSKKNGNNVGKNSKFVEFPEKIPWKNQKILGGKEFPGKILKILEKNPRN